MTTATDDHHRVWVLLIERGVQDGAELQLFRDEALATRAARRYLNTVWPDGPQAMPVDVHEAIEQYNHPNAYGEEHVLLSPWVVEER